MAIPEVTLLTEALMTEAEARDYLRLSQGKADPTLRLLINGVTKRAESEIGGPVLQRSVTEYHDGDGGRSFFLRHWPAASLSTLQDLAEDGTTNRDWEASEFSLRTETGEVILKSSAGAFSVGTMNIKATYLAGWASVPDDLKTGALILLAKWWRDHDKERDDVTSTSMEGQLVSYETGPLPRKVSGAWAPYVRTGAGGSL